MSSVLVIDDSITIRKYLRTILESSGYRVLEFADGRDGYELFKKEKPDFVIVDIFMPEVDGIQTIQKLKFESSFTKIIAISGDGQIAGVPYFDLCRRFGVVNCLNKPIKKDILLEALRKFEEIEA